MLILSRRKDERIVTSDGMIITVVAIRGDAVRLGFTAPDGLGIYREELFLRLQGEAEPAAGSAAS